MITEEEFLKAIETVNNYKLQVSNSYREMQKVLNENHFSSISLTEDTHINESGLSVLQRNILKAQGFEKLSDLKNITEKELKMFRYCGTKAFVDITECLFQAGIILRKE
jgi:DNA-directed RNA polymerase alpha subunit